MKRFTLIGISIVLITDLLYSQSVQIKDSADQILLQVNDEGANRSSITLPSSDAAPSPATNKLYNEDGILIWNGKSLVTGSSYWTHNGSNIYYNGGYVGIGTSSPLSQLSVGGNGISGATIYGYNISPNGWAGYFEGRTHFSGNVGIGTTNPTEILDVNGTIKGTGLAINGIVSGSGFTGWDTNASDDLTIASTLAGDVTGAFNVTSVGNDSHLHTDATINNNITINNGRFYAPTGIGNVGIGTTSPSTILDVEGSDPVKRIADFNNTSTALNASGIDIKTGPNTNPGNGNDYITFRDGDYSIIGTICGDGTGGIQVNTTSDARLKTKISDFTNGLDIVEKIKPRKYEMKSAPGIEQVGFIAQELYEVFPQAVSGKPDGDVKVEPMAVDYSLLTPLLVEAVKELSREVDRLKLLIVE